MTAGRVALPTLLAYAPPAFALGVPLFFVQFFLLKFATDVLLLAPAVIGAIFAVAVLGRRARSDHRHLERPHCAPGSAGDARSCWRRFPCSPRAS